MKVSTYDINTKQLIAEWNDAYAQLWMLHVGHKRLAIRLSNDGSQVDLYIVGVACEHITGPFAWEHAVMSVVESAGSITIADKRAKFNLTCHGVAFVQATVDEFYTSFESFFQD